MKRQPEPKHPGPLPVAVTAPAAARCGVSAPSAVAGPPGQRRLARAGKGAQVKAGRVRALSGGQVRTVKNVLDRIEGFHQLSRRHRGGHAPSAVHRHARPLRDRAIVHLILGTNPPDDIAAGYVKDL